MEERLSKTFHIARRLESGSRLLGEVEAEEAAGGGVGEVGEEEEEEGEEEGDWGGFIDGEIGAGTTLSPLRGHSSSSSDEDEAIPRSSRRSERVRKPSSKQASQNRRDLEVQQAKQAAPKLQKIKKTKMRDDTQLEDLLEL